MKHRRLIHSARFNIEDSINDSKRSMKIRIENDPGEETRSDEYELCAEAGLAGLGVDLATTARHGGETGCGTA